MYDVCNDIVGKELTIRFLDKAIETYPIVLDKISLKADKKDRLIARIEEAFRLFTNQGYLNVYMLYEIACELPDNTNAYKFKKGGFRAYGWHSAKYEGVFIISHFALKTTPKTSSKDKEIIHSSWKQIEREGN